jgi:hypothetical protein
MEVLGSGGKTRFIKSLCDGSVFAQCAYLDTADFPAYGVLVSNQAQAANTLCIWIGTQCA